MKKLLTIITCLCSFGLLAQPSIGSANMPQNGDTLRYSIALPDSAVLASFNNTGANQNWNFNSLVPNRQGLAEYVASSQTPYSATVSNRTGELVADTLNLGTISVFDVYDFYDNSSSEFNLDYRGFSAPNPLPIGPAVLNESQRYQDKDEIYQFPLNYLDRDSSTFDFVYNNFLAGIYLGTSGYRINEVEAWGNVTTPYGTFTCLKVVTDVVSYDTVNFGTTSFGINNHIREYKWLSPQLRYPVANLSGNVVGGVFIPQNIQYRDSARSGLGNLFAPFALFNADTTIVGVGDSVQFNNNTFSLTPATYQWSISPATHAYINGTSSTSEDPEVQFNAIGFYDVQLIAQNSSGTDTLLLPNYIEVRQSTSLSETKLRESLKLYPNPLFSGEEMIVEAEKPIQELQLFDQGGRLLRSWEANNRSRLSIALNNLERGLYYLRIDLDGSGITKKVILH